MIAILCVSIINILGMFPIYYFNQTKREEFLKLFSTFPKDKIERLLVEYSNAIIEVVSSVYSSKKDKNHEIFAP